MNIYGKKPCIKIEIFISIYAIFYIMKSEDLQKLGFTPNEAKIYLVLLKYGPLQAKEISKKTQINRRTTYGALERLLEKGYISYSIVANKESSKPYKSRIDHRKN